MTPARVASEIEESIRELNQPVSSQAIGVRVLEKLREIDDVASVRFSSVYNDLCIFDQRKERSGRDILPCLDELALEEILLMLQDQRHRH